jgi:hypothetical protein
VVNFDQYGQTTEFDWSSNAQAQTVAAGLAGGASDAATVGKAIVGKSEDQVRADEVTRLTNLQKYNQLEACKAILEAGGFTCS